MKRLALLLVVVSIGCASAPKRMQQASSDFFAWADRYEAKCVKVVAPASCDCKAWQSALDELKASIGEYHTHNVKLKVPGGIGWKRLKAASKATKGAECAN